MKTHIKLIMIVCMAAILFPDDYSILYAAKNDTTAVGRYGQLQVRGNRIVDQSGNEIALRGMSFFWSQWMAKYYNSNCVQWLSQDWKVTVLRAAMGVESGGYLSNPIGEKAKVDTVVRASIDQGLYVIIDWHDHNAHNHEREAKAFFAEMAQTYGNYPNVIYEIYNEPEQVSWSNVVKPYAEAVIDTIRQYDPDNIIIVGTPNWCQNVVDPSNDTLAYNNISYAIHFYAASHKQWLRSQATTALNNGISLFCSEYGTCEYTGSGVLDSTETRIWWNFMDTNKISWCNWSIADKNETSAALVPGANAAGGWSLSDLSASGKFVREKIIAINDSILSKIDNRTGNLHIPETFNIRNFPNPFNSSTNFQFYLSNSQDVKIDIYNIAGERIDSILDIRLPAGMHNVRYDNKSLASGMYIYKIQDNYTSSVNRMCLIK